MAAERIEKPWGHELILQRTAAWTLKLLVIAPGRRLSLQRHRIRDEALYVAAGPVAVYTVEPEQARAHPRERPAPMMRVYYTGETFFIPAGMIHRFAGLDGATLVEVSDTLPDDETDIERFEDDHGRA